MPTLASCAGLDVFERGAGFLGLGDAAGARVQALDVCRRTPSPFQLYLTQLKRNENFSPWKKLLSTRSFSDNWALRPVFTQ